MARLTEDELDRRRLQVENTIGTMRIEDMEPDETTISLGFHEAMKAFRATWLWHHLPHPFDNAKAILLPKNDERSVRVAALLRQADVTDLGQHLADLVSHQN